MIFSSPDNVLNAKTDLEVMMKHYSVIFRPTFRKISHELPLKYRNGHHRPNSRLLCCPSACWSPQTMVHVNPPSIENTPCGLCAHLAAVFSATSGEFSAKELALLQIRGRLKEFYTSSLDCRRPGGMRCPTFREELRLQSETCNMH